MAATTIAASEPAFWVDDPRVMRESCLILPFESGVNASQRFVYSGCRAVSWMSRF